MSMDQGRKKYELFMKRAKKKGLTHKEALESWKIEKAKSPSSPKKKPPSSKANPPATPKKKKKRKPKTDYGFFVPQKAKKRK